MRNCVNAGSRMTGSWTPQSRIRTLRRRPLPGNHGSVRVSRVARILRNRSLQECDSDAQCVRG